MIDSSFISLWLEKTLDKISVFLNLLRLFLWPHIWSTLENAMCAFEKNVYSAIGWNVLHMSLRFIWSVMVFRSAISLLIISLNDLSIIGDAV